MTITVPRPSGLERFSELATELYSIEGCETGGPLHVELEDHNTEFLVGEDAIRKIEHLTLALQMAVDGNIPSTSASPPWDDATTVNDLVYYYGGHPEALTTSKAILEITKDWTEAQAAAAYGTWGLRCQCETYPRFEKDDQWTTTD